MIGAKPTSTNALSAHEAWGETAFWLIAGRPLSKQLHSNCMQPRQWWAEDEFSLRTELCDFAGISAKLIGWSESLQEAFSLNHVAVAREVGLAQGQRVVAGLSFRERVNTDLRQDLMPTGEVQHLFVLQH